LVKLSHSKAVGDAKTDGFAFTLAVTALVRANTDRKDVEPD
jgi:hypothetical protein